jgi:hypothetical protein
MTRRTMHEFGPRAVAGTVCLTVGPIGAQVVGLGVDVIDVSAHPRSPCLVRDVDADGMHPVPIERLSLYRSSSPHRGISGRLGHSCSNSKPQWTTWLDR